MTLTQYRNNNSYSSPSQATLNTRIPILEEYIQMRTGENAYSLVIGDFKDNHFSNATVYNYSRTNNTSPYTISIIKNQEVDINVYNTAYCYSNVDSIGYSYYNRGEEAQAVAVTLLPVVLVFSVIAIIIKSLFAKMI